jgi:hypothetical protein
MPSLSSGGSLIVPVHDLFLIPETVSLSGVKFFKKTEHHMTVVNYRAGKSLLAAIKEKPELEGQIQGLINDLGFQFYPNCPRFLRVSKPELETPELETIVVTVACDQIKIFYQLLAAFDPKLDFPPPPPHITLYTTDERGEKGIGLNSWDELNKALKNEDVTNLRVQELRRLL